MMRIGKVVLMVICVVKATSAGACDVSVGQWRLQRGDIVAVKQNDNKRKQKLTVEFVLSPKAGAQFADMTEQNIGKVLPLHIGAYKTEPVVRKKIRGGYMMVEPENKPQADQIEKDVKACI